MYPVPSTNLPSHDERGRPFVREERTPHGHAAELQEQRQRGDARLAEHDARYAKALERFYQLEAKSVELRAALRERAERRVEIRHSLQEIEARLAALLRAHRDPVMRHGVEADLNEDATRLRGELARLEGAVADLTERATPLGQLVERCRTYLTERAALGPRNERLARLARGEG